MQLEQKIKILERALEREKTARKVAEGILEKKSSELFDLSHALKRTNNRLEELLSEKTSELEGVFVNILDAYAVIDLQGNVLKMNEAAVNLIGYDSSKEDINLVDIVKPQDLNHTYEAFKKLYENGFYTNFKVQILPKNNREKIVQINASLIYNKEGKPMAIQGIARDITQETAIQNLTAEQKQQLNIVVENSPIGITLFKDKGKGLLMANKALCDMLSYSQEELQKLRVQDFTHPDDRINTKACIEKMYRGEIDTFKFEKRYLTKKGDIVWAKTAVSAVRNSDGNIKYQVATIEDITQEKLAKLKFEESKNRLSTLILNLQTGILLEDENGKILLTNNKFCEIFDIESSPEDLVGQDCAAAAELFKDRFKQPDKFVENLIKILDKKELSIGNEIELANGRFLERNFIPIFHEGVYKGHLWSYDDITIKKKYKENLQAQKEKYSNIIANMNLGWVEVNERGNILFANKSFCKIFGYELEELIGQNAGDLLLAEEHKHILKEYQDKNFKGVYDSREVQLIAKGGKIKHVLVSGARTLDLNGNINGNIGIHLDITEQKNLEIQKEELLNNLEKQNEQLNEYAHVVSHDLKSPLRSISALLSWTKEDFAENLGEESLVNLNLIEKKVEKMDLLIENILKYSSIDNGVIHNEPINSNQLVQNIIDMIFIPKHIKVNILKPLPTINADATRIHQLFQNLLSNAVNYIDKPKGIVEIDYEDRKSHYLFSIKDNGIGIKDEHHSKIFKIFNTLNDNEKSTGIGLSIVKRVVDLYHGEVWLESNYGKGTTFYFTLKK